MGRAAGELSGSKGCKAEVAAGPRCCRRVVRCGLLLFERPCQLRSASAMTDACTSPAVHQVDTLMGVLSDRAFESLTQKT